MYAYCAFNPANYSDACGQCHGYANNPNLDSPGSGVKYGYNCGLYGVHVRKPKKFSSADEAAAAYATNTYSSSSYSRHEYGAEIYTNKNGGYYLTGGRVGGPHQVSTGASYLPLGASLVATVHTHPSNNKYSDQDLKNAHVRGVNNYLIGPNLMLQRYNVLDNTTSEICPISPIGLSESISQLLESTLRESWDNHLANCIGFSCEDKAWPNQ